MDKNRLKNDIREIIDITANTERETSMEENNLEKIVEDMKNADGYMLTVTLANGTRLEHSLIIEKFDKINMLPSFKEIKELIIKELENETPNEIR